MQTGSNGDNAPDTTCSDSKSQPPLLSRSDTSQGDPGCSQKRPLRPPPGRALGACVVSRCSGHSQGTGLS